MKRKLEEEKQFKENPTNKIYNYIRCRYRTRFKVGSFSYTDKENIPRKKNAKEKSIRDFFSVN